MKKTILLTWFLLGGLAIFVLGNPYFSVFPTNRNQVYYIVPTGIFLLVAVVLKRIDSLACYWP